MEETMGVKLRERPGKGWYVFIDWKGKRKAKAFGKNKALAKEFAEKLEAKLKLGTIGVESKTGVKFEDYGRTWLDRILHTRKHSTHADYEGMFAREFLPAFKGLHLEDVTRERVKSLALACLRKGHSPKTVQNLIRALSSLLGHAVEDGLLTVNPALKPGKFLPPITKDRAINPYSREEVATLLELCKDSYPSLYPLLLCAVRSGLRQGELIALQWGDIDFRGRFIEVRRNCARGKLTTPKSGKFRRGDMSLELTQTLRSLHVERELETMQIRVGAYALMGFL
jgi:integrase